MKKLAHLLFKDPFISFAIIFLLTVSFLILRSIAPFSFPLYFFFFFAGIFLFVIFSSIDFDLLSIFSWQLYAACLVFLLIPLIIGQITRGAVRWIPLGSLTIQPSEIVRPFLLVFFANYLTLKKPTFRRFLVSLAFLAVPVGMILIQPSLGVSVLTVLGYGGVLIASSFRKRHLVLLMGAAVLCIPLLWFLLAPYQRQRVITFLEPAADPSGAGYNSLQSMISVGSGKLLGRGLGEGVQTQLSFLPERHTDFVFASVAEELGFVGAIILLGGSFFLLFTIIRALEHAKNETARCFIAGIFLTLFVQTCVHVGMNMGMLPITGVPLPLVSAGGSSLLATMIALGMVVASKKG